MNKKFSKAFIKNCNACFLTLKGFINRLQTFENYKSFEIFYINFNIIIIFLKFKF